MDPRPPAPDSIDARRKAARLTALVMGLIACGIFVAFILKGVLG